MDKFLKGIHLIIELIPYLFLFLLLFSLWGFYSAIYPFKIKSAVTPADYGVKYETISFLTKDGVKIQGWFIKSPRQDARTILLLHGYPADKGNILPSRIFLAQKYNLLLIDFRYLGESGGKYSTAGRNEIYDLLGALDYLKSRGIQEVGVWGFSMGGSVALMAGEQSPAIKAIVAESPYASLNDMARDYFHIPVLKYPLGWLLRFWAWIFLGYDTASVSPLKSSQHLSIPILITHSKQDEVVPFAHALRFQKTLESKPNVKFIFYDHLKHGEESAEFQQVVETFFDDVKDWR